jgi:hypothetical protein
MRRNFAILAAAAGLLAPISVSAGTFIQTGTMNGMTYKAQSRIVGQTSTATIAGGGNPIYFASAPKYSGVAALIMNYSSGNFICSGSLMTGGAAIVTAAHCVAPDATKGQLLSTTAYFGGGTSSSDFFNGVGTTAVGVNSVTINPFYTGEVIDQNDIAVLGLSALAPIGAQTYDILTTGDLTGEVFNVAGYGDRSDAGGSVGANIGAGRLRQGENSYDFRFGDSAFGGFFTDIRPSTGKNFFGTTADVAYSFLSDFDNGIPANNAACLLGGAFGNSGFCDLGRGALEVSVAGGDSGGPQFINGKLASVTSYGLSFGPNFGDIDGALNSSFGEFNGFVPTYIHESFIRNAIFSANSAIPEPSTWMIMIFGFAMVGSAMRRRPTEMTNASLG